MMGGSSRVNASIEVSASGCDIAVLLLSCVMIDGVNSAKGCGAIEGGLSVTSGNTRNAFMLGETSVSAEGSLGISIAGSPDASPSGFGFFSRGIARPFVLSVKNLPGLCKITGSCARISASIDAIYKSSRAFALVISRQNRRKAD